MNRDFNKVVVLLRSRDCTACHGTGTVHFPSGINHTCDCLPTVMISREEWEELGKPQTIEELMEKKK